MSISRRKMLALVGGGTVLAAAGAGTGFALTRTPHHALAPWDMAGEYADPRLRALSHALLAPNPHNRQPWMAELVGSDGVTIHRDPARDLPVTDPFARQLTIGMGCFLELMEMAAAEEGLATETRLFPEGEGGPVAACRMVSGGAPDPLFAHVMERRSCKEPFEDRPVSPQDAAALAGHARVLTEPGDVAALRELMWEAWQVEASTPAAHEESVDLFRFGRAQIEASPDGIDLGGPMLEGLWRAGVLTAETAADPASSAYAQAWEMYREMIAATPAAVVLTSQGNGRAEQIEAGRRWLRLNLATTGLGLSLHPVSQCLQEYPEMAAHHAAAHAMLAAPGETVQMLGRLGHGPATARTPRWPLEAKLMDA